MQQQISQELLPFSPIDKEQITACLQEIEDNKRIAEILETEDITENDLHLIFNTKEILDWCIDNDYRFAFLDAYLEDFFNERLENLYDISLTDYCDVPYWYETAPENSICKHQNGYYCNHRPGDIIEHEGEKYKFINTQLLDEELEEQTFDGKWSYYSIGNNFLMIFAPLEGE